MVDLAALFGDPYDRKARLYPALLVFLPFLIGAAASLPEPDASWAALAGIAASSGVAMLMTQIGRSRGKALEPSLFQSWNGKPSVAMLRHRDTRLPKPLKDRYRAFLERAVPDLRLPAPDEEAASPRDADEVYESANNWLLSRTRDRENFRILFNENTTYGFRRNVWALRPFAFGVDILSLLAVAAAFAWFWRGGMIETALLIPPAVWLLGFSALAHASCFAFFIRRSWVRISAEAYARELLAACDTLQPDRGAD